MEKQQHDKQTYAWLFAQSKSQHARIVGLSLLCALQAIVLVSFALVCRSVIDTAVAGNAFGMYASLAALAGVIAAQLILRLSTNSMQEHIRARFALELRQSLLGNILSAQYASAAKLHSGELSNRMFSDVQVVSNGTSSLIPTLVSMLTQLICAIAVLLFIAPPMVLLFACAAALAFLLASTMRGRLKALHKKVQEKEGAVRVYLQEALEHQLVIRSFGAQTATENRANNLQEDHFKAQMRRRGYSIAANASFSFFFNALYAMALGWCAFELLNDAMSYGTLMAVLQLVARIQAPVSSLSGMLPQLYQALASAERLMEIASLPPATNRLSLSAGAFYQRFSGISIQNMSFAYDDEENGRTGLSCESVFVPKGSFAVVSGPSGSGKSTLFKLVLGVCDAEGFVFGLSTPSTSACPSHCDTNASTFPNQCSSDADGRPNQCRSNTDIHLDHCSPAQAPTGTFAYVPQDNFLFAGTIRENIAFAATDATDAQVKEACEAACAWNFVKELPQGINTVIGEHGQGFSQGQLQRLAIARALCSNAPILVLDEVTSALDDETEAAVLENIANLPGKTVLVAAHRAKALEFATVHLRVENGILSNMPA